MFLFLSSFGIMYDAHCKIGADTFGPKYGWVQSCSWRHSGNRFLVSVASVCVHTTKVWSETMFRSYLSLCPKCAQLQNHAYALYSVCVFLYMFAGLSGTCAVGPSTIYVIISLPLLSNLVGMDEHDQHSYQTDERHQHGRAQSRVDVRDKAPRGETDRDVSVGFSLRGEQGKVERRETCVKGELWKTGTH